MRLVTAKTLLLQFFAVCASILVVLCCLPNNEYQKYQQLDGTIYRTLRWDYERLHYDPRPVDIAIFGPSKALLGLSASGIESQLSALKKPATVANFGILASGRNIESVLAQDLFATKRPKLLVIAIDETPSPWGHPAFKYVAPAFSIITPPAIFLHNFASDAAMLPYRQVTLFLADIFPASFGLSKSFDYHRYSTTTSDFTDTFRRADGVLFDMRARMAPRTLEAQLQKGDRTAHRSRLPRAISNFLERDDRSYTKIIVEAARQHGTKILFVYLPHYTGELPSYQYAYYERFGPVIDLGNLSNISDLYVDWAHLNHSGAMTASNRIAEAIARLIS